MLFLLFSFITSYFPFFSSALLGYMYTKRGKRTPESPLSTICIRNFSSVHIRKRIKGEDRSDL